MKLIALVLICGMGVPVPDCSPATALMVSERTNFPQDWCLDDPNAGLTSAQVTQFGNYEKILCDLRDDALEGDPYEPLEITDADVEQALNRGGPR